VLGGDPALSLARHPTWHALLDRGRAEHARLPLREEDRTVGLLEVVGDDLERAQLIGPAAVGARHTRSGAGEAGASACWAPPSSLRLSAARSSSDSATWSTSSIGSWRKRAPVTRNTSGSPVVMKW